MERIDVLEAARVCVSLSRLQRNQTLVIRNDLLTFESASE